jgi:hypothetical protein
MGHWPKVNLVPPDLSRDARASSAALQAIRHATLNEEATPGCPPSDDCVADFDIYLGFDIYPVYQRVRY